LRYDLVPGTKLEKKRGARAALEILGCVEPFCGFGVMVHYAGLESLADTNNVRMLTGSPEFAHSRNTGNQNGPLRASIYRCDNSCDPGAKTKTYNRSAAYIDIRTKRKVVQATP
jgi:hypothetical protein